MMSIAAGSSGSGGYYIGIGSEDYYLNGGEPEGNWLGRGARDLGLSGKVKREPFSLLLHGYSPDGAALIKNAGSEKHQAGWDITFSAPKSVSVVWGQADPELRAEIQKAQQKAAEAALRFLEEEIATTRRGAGGAEREAARLIVATFEHGTARQTKDASFPDPNLHTHSFIMNACTRKDGSRGTIESKPFYQNQHLLDALYKTELSAGLHRLGFGIERTQHGFEVKGVPSAALEEFSKRSQVIREELKQQGREGAKAAEIANLSTRETKGLYARATLFSEWQKTGAEQGFSTREVETLRHTRPLIHSAERETQQTLTDVTDQLLSRKTDFTRAEFLQEFARGAQEQGMDCAAIRNATTEYLQKGPGIVQIGERFTTAKVIEIQSEMLDRVVSSQTDATHTLFSPSVWAGIRVTEREEKCRLSENEKGTLRRITQDAGSIQAVSGMESTEKSRVLKSARIAWEREGYTIIGAAVSRKATDGLEDGTGIKSCTVAGLLRAIEGPDFKDQVKHELRQVGRALIGKGRYELTPFEITTKTVLVIDKAEVVNMRELARLIEYVTEKGGKLILAEDARSMQRTSVRSPFHAIADALKTEEPRKERNEDSGILEPTLFIHH